MTATLTPRRTERLIRRARSYTRLDRKKTVVLIDKNAWKEPHETLHLPQMADFDATQQEAAHP